MDLKTEKKRTEKRTELRGRVQAHKDSLKTSRGTDDEDNGGLEEAEVDMDLEEMDLANDELNEDNDDDEDDSDDEDDDDDNDAGDNFNFEAQYLGGENEDHDLDFDVRALKDALLQQDIGADDDENLLDDVVKVISYDDAVSMYLVLLEDNTLGHCLKSTLEQYSPELLADYHHPAPDLEAEEEREAAKDAAEPTPAGKRTRKAPNHSDYVVMSDSDSDL